MVYAADISILTDQVSCIV